ncbi:MAG: DNA polymerase I, partial [Lachnospiraceae bacterium]|nr:DNA polymerase I [Lachnospiraceae bacterium]
ALVEAEFGVIPERINSLKGLQGDSSDNIKGVPGVGPATAVKLIQRYGTVDNLYKAIAGLDKAGQEKIKKEWKEELGITRSPLNFLLKESETELVGEKSARISEELATIKKDIDLGGLQLEDLSAEKISREGVEEVMKELEFTSFTADFFDNDSPEEDMTDKFAAVEDFDGFEEASKLLMKASALGISYADGEYLSVVLPDGSGYCFKEKLFLNSRLFKDLVIKLDAKKIPVYTPDGKALYRLSGCTLRDVVIAAYLLNPLKSDYDIKSVYKEYCGKNTPLPEHECASAFAALLAGPALEKKLDETGMLKLYEEMELPVMGVLASMEDKGIAVKREALSAFSEELKQKTAELEQEIYALSGEAFNINSPKQLGEVLFDHLHLPHGKKTKSGYSTAADILERLAPSFPVVRKILDYRTYAKLNSTYAEGLQQFIAEDGRIHGTFNQTVTATGRLSSANPNLQNIPVRLELGREIRKVFVPEDGCIFIDADYSQIELRVLAHLSGDKNLIAAYREARDIHAITASQVFHVPLDEVTPLLRRNAKAVNFGIVYGISAFSLSEDLSITREEAQQYMRNYFATYPRIEAYLNHTVASAKELGYSVTMYGRRRPIPELYSVNFNQRSFGERVAMNAPIQGTAADIMKLAMIRVDRKLKEEGLKTRIVLQIHDELLLEAPEEEADRAEEILVREMESAADLAVKLEVEAKRGRS